MQQEAVGAVYEGIVDHLLVQLRAQCDGGERLSFTTGEECRSVGAGYEIHFAPDRAYFGGFASVEPFSFVQDAAAHGLFFHIVVIAGSQWSFCFAFLFGNRFQKIGQDGFKRFNALMFVRVLRCRYFVGAAITFVPHQFAKVLVVFFVVVGAFYGFAHRFGQFHLGLAMFFNLFVRNFYCFEHFGFRHFVHLAFHHHDVVEGSAHHDVYVGFFQFFECGVDHIFPVNACHTHFGDRTVERYIGYGQCCRSSETCQCVGHIFSV